MARVYNFSAGPSMLPEKVLKQAQAELLEYGGSGQSVMEMSHRSKAFETIIKEAEADLRELMNIPDNYKVLFLQGGASQQFAMIPMNLMKNKVADYIVTGQWAKKAAKEAAKAAKESKKTETTQGEAVSAGADDLTLLAAIIECEAGGESYECQLAVGAAVINRVKSSSYPNSISGVIYQKGQFGPASSGKLARKLSGRISSSCYSAAQEAMSGVDNTGGCTSFNDHGSGISIGNMKFR